MIIRALNPVVDYRYFEEAYSWRSVKRLSRMVEGMIEFEHFSHPQPNEVAMGMFNGQLEAVFLLEDLGDRFQVHFTSRPGLKAQELAAGALTVKNRLFELGAKEVFGYLREQHSRPGHPVRRFAESIGFFLDQQCSNRVILCGDKWVWWRKFTSRR